MAMLYTFDGKGDKGFSDFAFAGVQQVRSKLQLNVEELEPRFPGDVPGLIKATIGRGSKLVVSIGFPHAVPMTAAAAQNPKVRFVCIDITCTGPNVSSFLFKEHEGAYLA
jgi:basic membrane protein A